ncbi:MAG: radical SAM protein, partial [Anaerolineales bacterium]|nr:radical SAM protein [Anaerolineales bacterium]
MRPYRVPASGVQAAAPGAWEEVERLGLYVHVPFCETRCGYCEYCVIDPALNLNQEDAYFDLLLSEFRLWRQAAGTESKTLVGFDIGGGTPTLPKARQIERVVEAARKSFRLPDSVTISIETTPKIAALEAEKIRAYYAMGIRRISMGVQTVNPRLLQNMGRTATSLAYNQRAAENIRTAGYQKFNVDIMYGFAHQPLRSVNATVRHVISLEPEYVTLYRMRYKGTRIAGQAGQVSRGEVYAQYCLARELLLSAGYQATPGKNTFSRIPGDHGTSNYLTERVILGTPYLGLGLGAQSLSEVTLAYNAGAADKRLEHYRRMVEAGRLPIQDLYHLSPEVAMGKMIAVAFYFGEVNLPAFTAKFGLALEKAFPKEVGFVLERGLMEYIGAQGDSAPTSLRLTPAGVQDFNGVIALFYAGAVKAHLLQLSSAEQKAELGSKETKDEQLFFHQLSAGTARS